MGRARRTDQQKIEKMRLIGVRKGHKVYLHRMDTFVFQGKGSVGIALFFDVPPTLCAFFFVCCGVWLVSNTPPKKQVYILYLLIKGPIGGVVTRASFFCEKGAVG